MAVQRSTLLTAVFLFNLAMLISGLVLAAWSGGWRGFIGAMMTACWLRHRGSEATQ